MGKLMCWTNFNILFDGPKAKTGERFVQDQNRANFFHLTDSDAYVSLNRQ